MTLEQGNIYKKKKKGYEIKLQEGFTSAFPNQVIEKNQKDEETLVQASNQFNKNLSDFARNKQIALQETKDYLMVASRDNKYKNQNVTTSTGVSGYITQQGVFKPYNSKGDMNATIGKNNCPSGSVQLNVDSSTYTENGRNIAGAMPFPVGTPMVAGQRCGNEGENIYVSSVSGGGTKKYIGCKKQNPALQLSPYGKKADIPSVACPAGTFQCPNGPTGYCYDPSIKSMVSTYMDSVNDAPPGSTIVGKNSPYLSIDGVTYLWVRQSNNYDNTCGTMPTVPPCPKGTAPCPNGQAGYCWSPDNNAMVTTFSDSLTGGLDSMPKYMFLLTGEAFLNVGKSILSNNSNNINNLPLQRYFIDNQVQNQNLGGNNIGPQFRSTAEQICPYLKNGESIKLKLISDGNIQCPANYFKNANYAKNLGLDPGSTCVAGWSWTFGEGDAYNSCINNGGKWIPLDYSRYGYTCDFSNTVNSNNSIIVVKRINDTTSSIQIIPSGSNQPVTINYTFSKAFGNTKFPILSQDGSTKLYIKSNGFDTNCGKSPPSVPPTKLSTPDLTSCENVARITGSPVFAFGDGQCYIGSNITASNAGITSDNCVDMGSGSVGLKDSVAVYQLPGASNAGLGKYGFITADGKLKEYPESILQPTDKFKVLGNYKVPASSNNSYLTKILSGIPDVESCQKSCINELSNSCNGISYNPSSRSCEIYGSGTYPNGSPIEKADDHTMYIRQKTINNDISCPKEIRSVDSSVWNGYPKDGIMTSTTPCNLAAITENAVQDEINSLDILNQFSDNVGSQINNLSSLQTKLSDVNNSSNKEFEEGVAIYNDLYNASQLLKGKKVKEGFTSYDELRQLYSQLHGYTSISEPTEVGMKEDTERYLASQTAKFAAWGILAVGMVMTTIKLSNK